MSEQAEVTDNVLGVGWSLEQGCELKKMKTGLGVVGTSHRPRPRKELLVDEQRLRVDRGQCVTFAESSLSARFYRTALTNSSFYCTIWCLLIQISESFTAVWADADPTGCEKNTIWKMETDV